MFPSDPESVGGSNTGTLAQDTLSLQELAEQYGFAASFLEQFPSLVEVFRKILSDRLVDPNLIQARITQWMSQQPYTKAYIDALKQKAATNPKIWNAAVDKAAKTIRQKFLDAGATLPNDQTLRKYAEQSMFGGALINGNWETYDEEYFTKLVNSAIDFTKTKTVGGYTFYDQSGNAEDITTSLYQLAREYGLDSSMSNAAFKSWFEKTARAAVDGQLTKQDIDDELVQFAMSRFPGLAPQLQRGLTLREAADPYLKSISDALEMDAEGLDLNDDLVQRVLNSTDKDGNFKPMSIYQAKLAARKDDRWQYTGQAKGEYSNLANKVLQDFGFLG